MSEESANKLKWLISFLKPSASYGDPISWTELCNWNIQATTTTTILKIIELINQNNQTKQKVTKLTQKTKQNQSNIFYFTHKWSEADGKQAEKLKN